MYHKVEIDFHGRPLSIEVGRLAKQASGAALVQYGETVVLTTATASQSPRAGIDFFPLTVDYQEKAFAAGKIPGGFFKREGRLGEKEVLTSRLIDRPIRPLFAEGYRCETQIIATVLSFDKENDSDTVAMLGASAALHVSDVPFLSPIAGVRIGRIGGKFVINPLISQLAESELNLMVAGTKDSIVMVEGGAKVLSEDIMLDALYTALDALQPLVRPITCEVGVLPRTHGSALFTRGETQALVVTTLGTGDDEQMIDALDGEHYKSELHAALQLPALLGRRGGRMRRPGRREIGHGKLA
jgi:polyribonucleotide nucleotidyltransferase